jgi:hypothetical protein
MATGAGMPSESRMGSTITAMEITGPIPVMDIKIMAVTIHRSAMVILGLSPPSSTTLRIRVAAMPVSTRTLPKNAPKNTLTRMDFAYPAGPSAYTYSSTWMKVLPSMADVGENALPTNARAVQNVAMIANPTIRLNPFTQYHTMPKKDRIMIIPIITLMFIRTLL